MVYNPIADAANSCPMLQFFKNKFHGCRVISNRIHQFKFKCRLSEGNHSLSPWGWRLYHLILVVCDVAGKTTCQEDTNKLKTSNSKWNSSHNANFFFHYWSHKCKTSLLKYFIWDLARILHIRLGAVPNMTTTALWDSILLEVFCLFPVLIVLHSTAKQISLDRVHRFTCRIWEGRIVAVNGVLKAALKAIFYLMSEDESHNGCN